MGALDSLGSQYVRPMDARSFYATSWSLRPPKSGDLNFRAVAMMSCERECDTLYHGDWLEGSQEPAHGAPTWAGKEGAEPACEYIILDDGPRFRLKFAFIWFLHFTTAQLQRAASCSFCSIRLSEKGGHSFLMSNFNE